MPQAVHRFTILAASIAMLLTGCQTNVTQPKPAPTPAPAPVSTHVSLSADTLFAFGKADLKSLAPDIHQQLDQLVGTLRATPKLSAVQIVGYTDQIGSDAYNVDLSQRRAEAVRDYLIANGISGDLITAEGRGKAKPVVDCPHLAGKQLRECLAPNRRVEVNILVAN
jgi:OmpA-OmpF porin, OOP family